MIQKSRFIAATAAALVLGGATMALADGASENTAGVMGSITPAKLDKKKFKPVTLYSGVTTTTTHAVPGQQNAEKVTVEYPTNIKFDLDAAPVCTAPIAGTTTDQARAACPPTSNIGEGVSHANLGGGPDQVSDVTVTVFHGPGESEVSLHAFSPSLGAANTQVVLGRIVDKAPDPGFGPALIVDDAPDLGGDAFMLTLFDATIPASTKAVLGRCKTKTNKFRNITVYDDGTTGTADLETKCKQKKPKN